MVLFFSIRNQNHTIGQSVRRTNETHELPLMRYVYSGISMASTYNPLSGNDEPIDSISFPERQVVVNKRRS